MKPFQAKKYRLKTIDSNSGSAVAPITDVTSSLTITKPTDPTKSGYTTDGWLYNSGEMTYECNFACLVTILSATALGIVSKRRKI